MKYFCIVLFFSVILLKLIFITIDNSYYVTGSRGASMTPCWEENGKRKVYYFRNPQIGDAINFQCFDKKCKYALLNKFIIDKKDDCIYVVGCNKNSFDSRNYGYLCGNQYHINGVIEEYNE